MRFLSENQMSVLDHLQTKRLPVLDVHATTASALMYRGAICYHIERNGGMSYRVTKEGQQLLRIQKIMQKSKPFKSIRTDVVKIKRRIK